MYVVTNRQINEEAEGLAKLGDTPSEKGPNELRLVEATKTDGEWQIDIVPDVVTAEMKAEVGLTAEEDLPGSAYVAKKIFARVQGEGRNFLFFIHGFNNDVRATLDRAESLSHIYGVEVVPFSWPANGGGWKGIADYKNDKRDARASTGALGRCFDKMYGYLTKYNEEQAEKVRQKAYEKYPDNAEEREIYIAKKLEQLCPFTVNMLLHSMGNYLLEWTMRPDLDGLPLIFDNVILAAADTNNLDHAEWVDKINVRNRIYITINEQDYALQASRMKFGQEQLPRLGHYVRNLTSEKAVYVDFTGSPHVRRSHTYFGDEALKNDAVQEFFKEALNGKIAEDHLRYRAATGVYYPRR